MDSDCDVVAVTGDCVSQSCDRVPAEWDDWPQELKLSVPGNHDLPYTFDLLNSWYWHTPWARQFRDVLFVGLDSLLPHDIEKHLASVCCDSPRAIALLCHERPRLEDAALADVLLAFIGSRRLLVLHGHEHPSGFSGAEWDESGRLGQNTYCRSKICSSVSSRRGLCHLIEWSGNSFHCSEVQGLRDPI